MHGYASQKGGVEGDSRFWQAAGRVRMWLRVLGLGMDGQVAVSGRGAREVWNGMVTIVLSM